MNFISFLNRFQFYLWAGFVWLLLWSFSASMTHEEIWMQQVLNEVWRTIYVTVVNLIFFEFVLPFISKNRKRVYVNLMSGVFLTGIHLILLSFGLYCWKTLGVQFHIYTVLRQVTIIPDTETQRMIEDVLYQAQGGITSFIFFGLAKLLYDNYRLKQATQQLLLEKKEAELNYLKSQTNPHFLFNTLHNIYSLAIAKSEQTPESILKLSSILRFMLYETGGKFITLEQETKIMHDYIALERLRYDDTLSVRCVMDIEDGNQKLPPLLLIPLVENAFKHGVSETFHMPFVEINLVVKDQQLAFSVKNSFEASGEEREIKENIGLSNVRRQLELLYSDYSLTIQPAGAVFEAKLKINLRSHV